MPCFLTHTTHLSCLHVTPSSQHTCRQPNRCTNIRELFFTSRDLCSTCLSSPISPSSPSASSRGDWACWVRGIGAYTGCTGDRGGKRYSGTETGTGWSSGSSGMRGNRDTQMLGCQQEIGRGVYEIDVSAKGRRRVLQQQGRRGEKAGRELKTGDGNPQSWGGWIKSILSSSPTNIPSMPPHSKYSKTSSGCNITDTPRQYTTIEADDWEVEEAELAENRRGGNNWMNEKWLESWVELEIPGVDYEEEGDWDGEGDMDVVEREVECY
ncbi:hypothetical protein BZA77DRAFT_353046 [Pyronema omphalodes]|nr:hypothetical protein BZA77DRAFT_353046 [Pyronema omphalodes]